MSTLKDKLEAYIAPLDPAQYRMLDQAFFAGKLGVADDDDLKSALEALSSGRDAPLDRWAMLFAGEEEYAVEDEDLEHFDRTGEVVHPDSGELIPNAADHVVIYYAVRATAPANPAP